MSNQRSEQPVSVCPDCGGTKENPNCHRCRKHLDNHIASWCFPSEQNTATYMRCANPFHSSTEQGSQPTAAETIGWIATQKKRGEPQTGFPKPEPTAQTVAGESIDPPIIDARVREIADLRHQLAERYAVIEKVRANKAIYDLAERDESVAEILNTIEVMPSAIRQNPEAEKEKKA